ncbi:MAG TPA: hypothetical protein VFY84_11065 [Jiangellales bacterium]|nr:hypothetical protein [Jiangellales bacterium]
MSADEILLGAQLPEDTVRVCTRGDLVERFRRLDEEVARSRATVDPRLAGADPAKLAELEDLREQIEAATVPFHLRALGRRWNALADEHPPRKGTDGKVHPDDTAGVNNETFFPALIRASTVSPKLRDETWEALLDPDGELLSEAQYRRLRQACWDLNVRMPDVPFSVAGLLTTRTSGSESGSPEPSASPSSGSTGGSRKRSPSTSTNADG